MKNFDAKYTGNEAFNCESIEIEGCMETYSADVDKVIEHAAKHPRTVWTIVEDDNGELCIMAGLHYVNRFLYFISNESWTVDTEEYKWA